MVAGSDSMWVRMEAMLGISARMLASRRVTRSWGGAEREGFIDFEVKLEVEGALVLLDGEIVDGEGWARAATARDAVVDGFGEGGGGYRVGRRRPAPGRMRWTAAVAAMVICSERWKVRGAGHGEGEIGEVAGAGAAGAEAVDREGRRGIWARSWMSLRRRSALDRPDSASAGVASRRVSRVWRARRQETVRMMAETARAAMGSASSRAGEVEALAESGGGEAEENGGRRTRCRWRSGWRSAPRASD